MWLNQLKQNMEKIYLHLHLSHLADALIQSDLQIGAFTLWHPVEQSLYNSASKNISHMPRNNDDIWLINLNTALQWVLWGSSSLDMTGF
jgi:hypothetical protein